MTNEKMSASLDSTFNESNPPSTNYGESDSFLALSKASLHVCGIKMDFNSSKLLA